MKNLQKKILWGESDFSRRTTLLQRVITFFAKLYWTQTMLTRFFYSIFHCSFHSVDFSPSLLSCRLSTFFVCFIKRCAKTLHIHRDCTKSLHWNDFVYFRHLIRQHSNNFYCLLCSKVFSITPWMIWLIVGSHNIGISRFMK